MSDTLRTRIETLLKISLSESANTIVDHLLDKGTFSDSELPYLFFELAEILQTRIDQQLHGDDFWKVLDIVVTVFNRAAPGDPSPHVAVVRACTDRLRRQPGLYVCRQSGDLFHRRDILTGAATLMQTWGDITAARGLLRQQAELLVRGGHFPDAFTVLDNTVQWLRHLTVQNLLYQAECLEKSIQQDGMDAWRIEKITFLERLCAEAADRFRQIPRAYRARLYHSAALIHRACNETVPALELLEQSARIAGIEIDRREERPSEPPVDLDTRMMILSSWLQTTCAAGHLARADELFFLGQQILAHHAGEVMPIHRFTFRQNAAGYLYRIGNIREAERMYRRIDAEDAGGRIGGRAGHAAVLSSKALIYRKQGYLRRSERYHRKALEMLQGIRRDSAPAARAQVHLATAQMDLGQYDDARKLLEQATAVFIRNNMLEDCARSRGILARCHAARGHDEAALNTYAAALKTLDQHAPDGHELEVSLSFGQADTLARLNRPADALESLEKADRAFHQQKWRFRYLRARMNYSRTHRPALIRSLTIPGRSMESRWNSALRILENDRADLFADSLSYYVKALDDPKVHQLYLSFLELQSQYLHRSGNAVNRSADGPDNLLQTEIDNAFKILFRKDVDASGFITGHDITVKHLLDTVSENFADHRIAACILDTQRLHIFTAVPDRSGGKPCLDHITTGFQTESGNDRSGTFIPLDFNLEERMQKIRAATETIREHIREKLELLQQLDSELRPPETEHFQNQWRQLRRLSRRNRRKTMTLRTLVESSVYLINFSFLLIRICGLHPEFRGTLRRIHPVDRVAFETLFDILIRPVNSFYPPDARVVLFVSELLSRVSFESLIDSRKALPEGYFVFPDRSFNYFRSPGLCSRVLRDTGSRSNPDFEDRSSMLTLFTPLEPDVTETADAYQLSQLAKQTSADDRKVVFRWLRSRQATRKAFEIEAPRSNQLLVESHCTFDRIQPFLSRLLFAGGEPVTAMDIFARYTFDITALMILVACESDQIYDIDIENVGVSVAEAMLCKGIDRIVAPKWMIERRTARELIRQFVTFIGSGEKPVDALSNAHRAQAKIRGLHPYYWAGFSFSGRPAGC